MIHPKYLKEISPDVKLVEFTNQAVQTNKIYVKPGIYAMSNRKVESLIKIAELQKYYQCNPVRFISDWFGVELLDVQAWIITRSWTCGHVLIVASRGIGKSTVIDLMLMAKDMLFCNYWTYICSGSGSQAQQTFMTLERLANNQIDTMVGSTGEIFKAEIEVKNASGDGFSHSADGFHYNLFNGSMTQTLNSNVDKKRGMRGNVVFDESAFLSEELLNTYAAFSIVNKSFKTGKDRDGNLIDHIRLRAIPPEIPNQLFYISSASSTDTEYYRLYREFSKKMLMGDPDYFVAHIDCEVCFAPTLHGQVVAPLLERSTVESALRTSPEKARREYYCEFTHDIGASAIIRRGVISRNEEVRKPLLYNDTGDKKFIICYDPARSRDNSAIVVMEVYTERDINGVMEYRGRIVNCVNLMDTGKKIRSPMRTPEQVDYLKQLILDYNQGGDENYSNIIGIYIDAGSGGGGVNIADYLMSDWKDSEGNLHKGLIDKEYSEEYIKNFPDAVDKIHLMSPTKYKSEMFEALIELSDQNKISYTASYDSKGYITLFDVDEEKLKVERERILKELKEKDLSETELHEQLRERLLDVQSVNTKVVQLDWQEEHALANIDAMKEEVVNIVRKKREGGKDSFDLAPEKANKLHDDRAYCLAMSAYGLQNLRRKSITEYRKPKNKDLVSRLPIKKGTRQKFME